MNIITVQLCRFLVGFCILLSVACQPTATTITLFTATPTQNTPIPISATPKVALAPTPTMVSFPTVYFPPTPTNTFTLTPGPTRTLTPLPTLSPNEALAKVQWLYETNNGCLLPCWWGITPGITYWSDAKHFLAPISSFQISDNPSQNPDSAEVYLPNTYYTGLDAGRPVDHQYMVENGVVQAIDVWVSEPSSFFAPASIVNDYGIPEEIYMNTWQGGTGYSLTFFYPHKGFLIRYNILGGNNDNKIIRACLPTTYPPSLKLWFPEKILSYIEADAITSPYRVEYDLPLVTATGIDVATFSETLKNSAGPICLETPTNLWPGY